MCGIAGIVPSRDLDPAQLERWVRRMRQLMVHRGPDDEGVLVAPDIGIGARRLAIIDRAHGQQPMTSDDGALTSSSTAKSTTTRPAGVVEAAGCQFRTESDTEVVLRCWSDWRAGILQLEGMFAFAVREQAAPRLILARDWLGQKSLYWTEAKGLGLRFGGKGAADASRCRSQGQSPVAFALHVTAFPAWRQHLLSGYPETSRRARHDGAAVGNRSLRELWRPAYEPKHALGEAQILDRLDELLSEVVREHLMSEVPLGAFLSGGIDSSLVVAYASPRHAEPLTTFAIGVQDPSQSELPWAREVAERYQHAPHGDDRRPRSRRPHAKNDGGPGGAGGSLRGGVYVVSESARRHVTVALGGDGATNCSQVTTATRGRLWPSSMPTFPGPCDTASCVRSSGDTGQLRVQLARRPSFAGWTKVATAAAFTGSRTARRILRFPHALKRGIFAPEVWRGLDGDVSEELLSRYFNDGCAEESWTGCCTRTARPA